MNVEEHLVTEIVHLQKLIDSGKHNGEPRHLLKMYQSLIKSKKTKLKHLLSYG